MERCDEGNSLHWSCISHIRERGGRETESEEQWGVRQNASKDILCQDRTQEAIFVVMQQVSDIPLWA